MKNLEKEAASIEGAVQQVLSDGARTADIAAKGEKAIGTAQMGNLIVECLK